MPTGFQLHLSRIAQQSEDNVSQEDNTCVRDEKSICIKKIVFKHFIHFSKARRGADISLKFIWAITGTEELGPIKFCQGQ